MKPKCLECDGRGYHDSLDLGQWRRDRCVFCHGSGEADVADEDEADDDES